MAPAETPAAFLRIAHRDLKAAWNQHCAELLNHVASLLP
jgi:hypothetical protein